MDGVGRLQFDFHTDRDRLADDQTMTQLVYGLSAAGHYEDALSVQEAELAMRRRLGASADAVLAVQSNLASTYEDLGRLDEALSMRQEVYSGHLKLNGEEAEETFREALNYSSSLVDLKRFEVAKALLRKTMPVARRVLGPEHRLAFKMRWVYARALYEDDRATLDNLREAVATLEETERTARRVLGGAHPATEGIEFHLREARAALRARENAATGDPD